jgi:uncharacterized surface protein with fasciclin (FAS1) repeats
MNVNSLSTLCEEVNALGLDLELNDCNLQLTLFAPSNLAFDIFFRDYDDEFFANEDNAIISTRSDGERKLQSNSEFFRNLFMTDVLFYNIASDEFRYEQLICDGNVTMTVGTGETRTKCNDAQNVVVGQKGTCNDSPSRFRQTDVFAANGVIHLMTRVLVPSPTTEAAGCLLD